MRTLAGIVLTLFAIALAPAQPDRDFTGVWKLNPARSEVSDLPKPLDATLEVRQNGARLVIIAGSQDGAHRDETTYSLDGRESKHRSGGAAMSTITKWEGGALLVNTLVTGPPDYVLMERWKLSRDGSQLTIRRTFQRLGRESESVLVYENPAFVAVAPANGPQRALKTPEAPASPGDYVVEAGTRILLSLVNSVNTKNASPGDRIYLETAVPVFSHGRLVIPRGSYVTGTVTEAARPGRVKGRASLQLRFDALTLPNGVARDFRSRAGSVDNAGGLDRKEGKIKGEDNKDGDVRTIGTTTAAGAGIGTLAGAASGHAGMGAGIGAAAGAAAGLAGVLASRGPELVLPRGTTMELVLDRTLHYSAAELP